MSVGEMHTVLVCVPSQSTQLPCPSGMALQTADAYLITPAASASLDAQYAAFDYAVASAIWGFVFTFVVGLFLVSKSAGTILQRIRS